MTKTKNSYQKQRTYARNRPRRKFRQVYESDGSYFLKLVGVAILSTFWIKFSNPMEWGGIPMNAFPLGGLIVAVLVKTMEKDPLNRKIWFAVLLIVMIISYFVPAGVVI